MYQAIKVKDGDFASTETCSKTVTEGVPSALQKQFGYFNQSVGYLNCISNIPLLLN